MLRCVPYTDELEKAWDCLAAEYGSIFHTTAFRRILTGAFGYQCAYHALVDELGSLQALLPLVIGRTLTGKRAGAALPFINHLDICARDDRAFQQGLTDLLALQKQYGLSYLELRFKDQRPPVIAGTQVLKQHYTFELPLTGTEEQLLALSAGSNRNHVRKAYRNNWFQVSFDLQHLPAFYKVYCRRMHELGSPAPPRRFFELFFRHLPEQAHLLTVLDSDTAQVVGGMLLVVSPADGTLYYPYGANLIEYNHRYLNNFMYWEAVRFGMRQGLRRLDLGRSQLDSGTYRYKAQWGAAPKPLQYWLYDGGAGSASPPDKEKLHLLIELWKVMPQALADWAGPRLISHLLP